MDREEIRHLLAGFVGVVLLIVTLAGLGWGLNWFHLRTGRPMAVYAEETRHETFETSAAHQDGVNRDIMSQCLSMRATTDKAAKHAFAQYILSDAGTYEGRLTGPSQQCVDEARQQ